MPKLLEKSYDELVEKAQPISGTITTKNLERLRESSTFGR